MSLFAGVALDAGEDERRVVQLPGAPERIPHLPHACFDSAP